jgi:N-formylglutamate deformylase
VSAEFLELVCGAAPLVLSIPHAGTEIPEQYAEKFKSSWLARRDADWWLPQLYGFAEDLGASVLRTHISRSVIDVNRDPSGASLYPGQAVTGLCPLTNFDGEDLYPAGCAPDEAEIAARRVAYFEPYHAALTAEIARLRQKFERVVVYDCHSIRSKIPLLFVGDLPNFNIGTNDGKSCDAGLTARVAAICAGAENFSHVVNGRFKGGWITRHHANPANGVHALQMELACRGYMREPETPAPENWPSEYDEKFSRPLQAVLQRILESALEWSRL